MKTVLNTKKIIIMISAVLLTVAVAVLAAVLVIKTTKKAVEDTGKIVGPSGTVISESSEFSESAEFSESSEFLSIFEETNSKPVVEKQLSITSPSGLKTTVTTSKTVITGTSDIGSPLTMNGKNVERSSDGSFSVDVELEVGKNTFEFKHKGKTVTCVITYKFTVISSYSPSSSQKYSSGSTFVVSAVARPSSKVTATFNGKTITLTEGTNPDNKEFVTYAGSFELPKDNVDNLNLGKVKFVGTYNGKTDTYYSGSITCLAVEKVTSKSYVAEVIAFTAETFDGSTTNDNSDPRCNYLPKGTVDYCDKGLIYDPQSEQTYIKLRCGRRVYLDKPTDDKKSRTTVTKRYKGTLPDHNEIGVASFDQSGRHTVITFDTDWKAPFLLDIYPQSYANGAKQDFTFSNATFQYVEIKFCYATVFKGSINIPKSNPVFKSAKVIKKGDSHVLRLYLKKKGMFYGWDSYYNSKGQLCLEFLNPANTKKAANEYGVDLTGTKILIDAGHGGSDPGTVRGRVYESNRNLYLAYKVRAELKKIGATVVMTRKGDYSVTSDERRQILKREKPDYCLAIHHNAAGSSSANGFEGFHFNAFSRAAAKMVYDRSMQTGLYSNSKFKSHYFFMCRMTACPTVLTESGYFSNVKDFNNIISESANTKKAKAMVKGIADYFISIQYTPVIDDTESNSSMSSKPASSTASKPASSTASKPATSTVSKPASSTASKPATSTASKPTSSTASKPVTSTESKPDSGTESRPDDTASSETNSDPAEPSDDSSQSSSSETSSVSSNDSTGSDISSISSSSVSEPADNK